MGHRASPSFCIWRRVMRRIIGFCVAVIIGFGAGPDAFRLTVSPRFGRAPQDIHIITRIEPDAANRQACVEVDGPMYQSTCSEIDGTSPRTREFWLKGFPGGQYSVRLVVTRVIDGKHVEVTRSAQVCISAAINDPNPGCEQGSDGPESLQGEP